MMIKRRWHVVIAAVLAAGMPSCSSEDGAAAPMVTPAGMQRALQVQLDAIPVAARPVVSRADGRTRVVFNDREAATAHFPALLQALRQQLPEGGAMEFTLMLSDESGVAVPVPTRVVVGGGPGRSADAPEVQVLERRDAMLLLVVGGRGRDADPSGAAPGRGANVTARLTGHGQGVVLQAGAGGHGFIAGVPDGAPGGEATLGSAGSAPEELSGVVMGGLGGAGANLPAVDSVEQAAQPIVVGDGGVDGTVPPVDAYAPPPPVDAYSPPPVDAMATTDVGSPDAPEVVTADVVVDAAVADEPPPQSDRPTATGDAGDAGTRGGPGENGGNGGNGGSATVMQDCAGNRLSATGGVGGVGGRGGDGRMGGNGGNGGSGGSGGGATATCRPDMRRTCQATAQGGVGGNAGAGGAGGTVRGGLRGRGGSSGSGGNGGSATATACCSSNAGATAGAGGHGAPGGVGCPGGNGGNGGLGAGAIANVVRGSTGGQARATSAVGGNGGNGGAGNSGLVAGRCVGGNGGNGGNTGNATAMNMCTPAAVRTIVPPVVARGGIGGANNFPGNPPRGTDGQPGTIPSRM